MLKDPIVQFGLWFKAAQQSKTVGDATAMCLSTLAADGYPDARMVLLKGFDHDGFVFYTNLHSPKGRALTKTPSAALTFYWEPLERQVRVQGKVERVTDAEANLYWKTRPRVSQLGAWASKQSAGLPSRALLVKRVAAMARKYAGGPVPRPPYWTGVRVMPRKIEFWQGRANRLHDRFLYTKINGRWQVQRLYP